MKRGPRYDEVMDEAPRADVLAIDVGATSIKLADVTLAGHIIGNIRRKATPYPCSPSRLVEWPAERIGTRDVPRVAVGFPGEYRDGVVIAPGNLSRVSGAGSPIDEAIDRMWRGFALTEALRDRCNRDVRVVNDAALAALGSVSGVGRELMVTLGTGFGIALVVDGNPAPIDDYGQKDWQSGRTFDEAFGERARSHDENSWATELVSAVKDLLTTFNVDRLCIGGGNAPRLRRDLFATLGVPVSLHGNRAPLIGAARLFAGSFGAI